MQIDDEEMMVWLGHWLHCDLSPSALSLSSFPSSITDCSTTTFLLMLIDDVAEADLPRRLTRLDILPDDLLVAEAGLPRRLTRLNICLSTFLLPRRIFAKT